MKRQRKGKIINQSSTAAFMGNAGIVETDGSRRAVTGAALQRVEDRRLGADQVHRRRPRPVGINVNAIGPGVTLTEAAKRRPRGDDGQLPDVQRPEGAAAGGSTGTAVFLASEDSDMMTGQCLVVDGGMFMLG